MPLGNFTLIPSFLFLFRVFLLAACIDEWIKTNPTCPLCRVRVEFDDWLSPSISWYLSFTQSTTLMWSFWDAAHSHVHLFIALESLRYRLNHRLLTFLTSTHIILKFTEIDVVFFSPKIDTTLYYLELVYSNWYRWYICDMKIIYCRCVHGWWYMHLLNPCWLLIYF